MKTEKAGNIVKKRWIAYILLAAVLLCGVITAAADSDSDDDYEGELDIETGKPKTDGSDSEKTRVTIQDGSVWDNEVRQYFYQIGTAEVGMSVPSGAVTMGEVKLTVPTGMTPRVYNNGKEVGDVDLTSIKDIGSYVIDFGEDIRTTLSFTIVGPETTLTEYRLPSGFVLDTVTINAQKVDVRTNLVDMSKEGNYSVQYHCDRTDVAYALNVKIDHTAPTLKLEAVKDGYADGPVDISDVEKGARISVYHNGDLIDYEEELTKSGNYRIVLQDKAGNRNEYKFRINVYFNGSSVMFIVLVAAVLIGVGVYIFLSRKKLRVR